jgi:hypothetical protein
LRIIGVPATPGAKERVLNDLPGELGVTEDPQGERIDESAIPLVQGFER